MKKRRQLLALLGLVMSFNLLFAGCSANAEYPTDEAYHFDTDAQYMLFPTATERVFAESEDGYYFNLLINGQVFLFFADQRHHAAGSPLQPSQLPPLCGNR